MWPWRSLVPTIEIVTWGGAVAAGAWDSPACVGGATSSNEASATALIYDARMRIVSWGLGLLVMTGAACGGGLGTPDGGGGSGGAGGADPTDGPACWECRSIATSTSSSWWTIHPR